MAQNTINLTLSEEKLTQASQGLEIVEHALAELISLKPIERQRLTKMGQKSEAFCRQALTVLKENPKIVPPGLDLAGAQADLLTLDQLAPLLVRLQRLTERARDSEMALGADVMDVALEGYALLKVSGKQQGLDGLRKELSGRWARNSSTEPESTEA